jgi:poly-gamma-glutamate capsule biosynthesis protein CapA/YwtB (metallophosphatase superfamily)
MPDGDRGMDRRAFLKGAAAITAMTAAAETVAAQAARPAPPKTQEAPARPDLSWAGRFTLAAVGDCLLTRRVSSRRDPEFLALRELLHGVDCAWGNCELVLADARRVYAMPKGGDPHAIAPPWAADEMVWTGLDFVGVANNHTLDFGYDGFAQTLENLERVGLPYAGAGIDLAQAARPAYFDSPVGRVAQVNCASTFLSYFAASPAHPYLRGRAGINPLSIQYAVQADRDLFARLKKTEPVISNLMASDEYQGMIEDIFGKPDPNKAAFFDTSVVAGDRFDLLTPPNPGDVKRITEALAVARNNARLVLATIHAHESRDRLELPDPFVQPFARACIDAGADAFLLAGPHVLRGIEIYKGRPIFYSLGNFFFQHETIEPLPAEAYASYGLDPNTLDVTRFSSKISTYTQQRRFWESFVPVVTYEADRLVSVELHPTDLGHELPMYERGIPHRARGERARTILERLAELSKPYGTRIAIEGDTGHVELTS